MPRIAHSPSFPSRVKPPPLPPIAKPPPLPSAAKPPPLPPEAVLSQDVLCLIFLLAKLAKVDGVISKEEIAIIDQFFCNVVRLDSQKREVAITTFRQFKDSAVSFEGIASEYRQLISKNTELLNAVIELLMAVALVDGELNADEDDFIKRTVAVFQLKNDAYARYRFQREASERDKREKREKSIKTYLNVLGLKGTPTREQVKKAYRDLVGQCHPDRNHHLPPRLKEIAEQEMKRINNAYDYLCKEGVG